MGWDGVILGGVGCPPLSVHNSKGNGVGDGGVHGAQPTADDAGALGVEVLQEGVTVIQVVLVHAFRELRLDVAH